MSSQIGTLQQRPRFGHLVVPAVAIALLAAVAIVTTNVVLDRSESTGSSTARSMNASAERWSATADAYAGGSSVVATDGARWTAAAEAYGALSAPAVLGITTPSELGGMFGSTSEPATGIGRRGVTPRVGSTPTETSSPNGTSSVGGDTDASYHPLP